MRENTAKPSVHCEEITEDISPDISPPSTCFKTTLYRVYTLATSKIYEAKYKVQTTASRTNFLPLISVFYRWNFDQRCLSEVASAVDVFLLIILPFF
jgi:hypothetical protein